jgi:carboxymethylenebutenolidase
MDDMKHGPAALPVDQDWTSHAGVNRRALLGGSAFAAGFAAACQPVAATTLRTEAVIEQMTHVKGPDGFAIPVFTARLRPRGNWPVIIVVHEVFGVHEWIKDICRRFARAGFLAVAPDLFARAGDATKVSDFKILRETIVSKTPDLQVLSDLEKVRAWALANGGKAGQTGITGFCWGGRIVWLACARSTGFQSGVAFYGRLTGPEAMTSMADAKRLKAPVLGLYGGKDRGIPQADVEAMNAALKAVKSPSHIKVYPDADHGFMADYRPSYNEPAAIAAWAAALAWLRQMPNKQFLARADI